MMLRTLPFAALAALAITAAPARAGEYLWIEAEHSTDVRGTNGSAEPPRPLEMQRGWGLNGPGVAAEWAQGGESEWSSIAAHPLEKDAVARFTVEIPETGRYRVWVRYADHQRLQEAFRVRVTQSGRTSYDRVYGEKPVVSEDDEVKLMWGWAFGWDAGEAELRQGPAELQLVLNAPSEARRHVDAILITDDMAFRPLLREKPAFHYLAPLRAYQTTPQAQVPALSNPRARWEVPAEWRTLPLTGKPFQMLWNMPLDFWKQDDLPADKRVLYPFFVQPGAGAPVNGRGPVLHAFIGAYGGRKDVPIFSSELISPVVALGQAGEFFADGSPFLNWLKTTKRPFGVLLNYQLQGPDTLGPEKGPMVARNIAGLKDQFVGYMAGENIAYAPVDYANNVYPQLGKLTHRHQVLDAIRAEQTDAVKRKFERAYQTPPTGNVWEPIMSALSVGMFPHIHALAEWGEKTLAHEATANDPNFAFRYAFLRGASRQFGRNWVWYQSSNFGDTATRFASGGYVAGPQTNFFHSHYDAFSGAGLVWYRKAYFGAYMAGAAAIYLEQGDDQYFTPSPGEFGVQLSPFGRITDEFMRFAEKHPDRGVPYTPIGFLLDPGHGWYQYEFGSGAFSLPVEHNPAVLGYSRHDAMIRDWFNIAYYPLPVVEGEPATSPRQSFINSPMGDVFDVLVASGAPKATDVAKSYQALVLAGDVRLSAEWGNALREMVLAGGTLVVTDDQVTGPGAATLGLPTDKGTYAVGHRVTWKPSGMGEGEAIPSNTFRYRKETPPGTTIATSESGAPIAVLRTMGRGRILWVGVPKGLGTDNRATPLLSKIMLHVREGLVPFSVRGDVEYMLNRSETGWIVTLFNNRGNYKSQHGLGIPRREEGTTVTLLTAVRPTKATEWTEDRDLPLKPEGALQSVVVDVPAGGIRIIRLATP